jgi:hypothetical protein
MTVRGWGAVLCVGVACDVQAESRRQKRVRRRGVFFMVNLLSIDDSD